MKIKRGVVFADFHARYHDKKLLKLYSKFIDVFRPTEMVIDGDLVNLAGYATHHGRRSNENPIENVGLDFDGAEEILDTLCKYKCKYVFIHGNHEEFQDKYFMENPDQFDERATIENRLDLKKRGFKDIIKYSGKRDKPMFYKSGKLHFVHGWRGGVNAVRSHLINDYHANFVMGHGHKSATATSSNIEANSIQGYAIGCSSQLDWNYSRSRNSNHGFGVYYVLPNGNFNFYNIVIIDYKFIFEGVLYQ